MMSNVVNKNTQKILHNVKQNNYEQQTLPQTIKGYLTKEAPVCLLVEDVKVSQVLELNILKRKHLKCQLAVTGEEALILYGKHTKTLKLILLDIGLNSAIDGTDVCKAIRSYEAQHNINPKVVIIALTGSASSDARKTYQQYGMDDCWLKGIELAHKLQALIEDAEINGCQIK